MKRYSLLLVALLFSPLALAQGPVTGFPPFGSFQQGGFDAVNRQNLNVNFAIPVAAVFARGSGFTFSLVYDSLAWKQTVSGSATVWSPATDPAGSPGWGWKANSPIGGASLTMRSLSCGDGGGGYSITYSNYTYVDASGTLHPFSIGYTDSSQCGGGGSGTLTGYATDNSGYYMDASGIITAPIVYSPSGLRINTAFMGKPTSQTDTNGNITTKVVVSSSETDWTDSVGRTSLKIVQNATYTDYQYLDTTGTYRTVRMNFGVFQVKTNFGCSGVVEYTNSSVSLPTSVVYMANNTSYSFTYEATPGSTGYVTGRLQRVTLPTGGYYEYDYPATPNDGINCADGNVNSLTRVLNDGTTSNTWQYVRTQIDSSHWKTTVTAPQLAYDTAANQSTFTFTNGQETSQNIYQGSEATGTLLRTINTTYATNGTPATQTIIAENNQQSQQAPSYDSNGNLLSLNEYDWGSGAPGSLLRTTTYSYLGGSSYTSLNIINRATQKILKDGTGTVKSRTDTSYDGTTLTCVTGAAQHDDTNYGCSYTTRGNPTTVTTYTDPVALTGPVTKNSYYDSVGNLRQADLDCCQQKVWSYSATTQYAWPDSELCGATGGPQFTRSTTYDFNTGLVATQTDENNQVTSYTYDALNRLTDTARPDGSHVTNSYDDVAQTETVGYPISGTAQRRDTSYKDGLGRVIKRKITDASGTSYSIIESQYDALGRSYKVSTPHNSTAQYWTEMRQDALERKVKVIPPDGSPTSNNTTNSYAGNAITSTDPTGKQKKSVFDGSNRLASVYEPDPNNGNALTQQTSYTYTVFDSLASLTQGGLTRTYTYDGLGRMTSESTPEAGTVSYQYNSFSLKTQRTDTRGVITTYTYDTLNRPTGVSYNVGTSGVAATPSVTYTYGTSTAQNNNNRLLTMTDGVGSETYSYDVMGRVTQLQKVANSTTYTISRAYNNAGQVTSETYPSNRVVQQNYDAIGRLSSLSSGTTTYASSFGYNPSGKVTGFNYGNGVAATFGYTAQRVQLQSLAYAQGAQTLFSLTYGYTQNGGNNGQITSITDNVQSVRTLTLSYDALRRLTSGSTAGGSTSYPQWGLQWSYDRFGTRSAQSQIPSGGGGPTNSVTPSTSANLISQPVPPYAYEARGNMTGDGLNALAYDAENRLVTNTDGVVTTYGYDGNNVRVTKSSGSNTTVYIFSGGQVIAEYLNGSLSAEYIYWGGRLLATHAGTTLTYHHRDHLFVRISTDGTSGSVVGEQAHYPYGEAWYTSGTTTKYVFTTYERDPESGNDYAMQRYHANRLGRFLSPDPVSGSPGDPQSLNRYSYVANDPINRVDPSGLCDFVIVDFRDLNGWWVANTCCGPLRNIACPEERTQFELDWVGLGLPGGFPISVTCDQPKPRLVETFCVFAWFLARSGRTCGYLSQCSFLTPGIFLVSMDAIQAACGRRVTKCPSLNWLDYRVFARGNVFIAHASRFDVVSSRLK